MRSTNKFISEDIATLLRELNIYEVDGKITFPKEFTESQIEGAFIHWDFTQKYLAYIPKSRFNRFDLENYDDVYNIEKRKNLAVFNRSFRKVFKKCNIALTDESARLLDGYFAKIQGDLEFNIVEAPSQYYSLLSSFEGNLGRSCMQGKTEDYFQIYDEEPNIKMLVALRDNLMVGRALIFINDENTYLDRRYAINDNIEFALQQYGLNKGWYIKANNNMDDVCRWLHKDNTNHSVCTSISIENTEYQDYPYMDTFKYLNDQESTLQTFESGASYKLVSTGGGYDNLNYVTCDHCEGDFDEDDLRDAYDSSGYDIRICDSCYYDYFYTCKECGEIHHEDNCHTFEDTAVCNRCLDENYTRCDECEEFFHNDEILYLENCKIHLCEECRGI